MWRSISLLVFLPNMLQLGVAGLSKENFTCFDGCTCNLYKIKFLANATKLSIKPTVPTDEIYAKCENLYGYSIREVFSTLPDDMEKLIIRDSNVTTLMDVCCLSELRYLDLSNNRITDALAYYQFEKVVYLNLQANNLRILRKEEFMSFPNVEILNLNENNIHYVDQEAFRLMSLRQLTLSRNKISYISERSFRFMPFLEALDVSNNKLVTLHAGNFFYSKKLRFVDLSNNKLMHIDMEAFEPLERVETINLSFNNLTELPPTTAFQSLHWLKHLAFDGNPIDTLKYGTFYNLTLQSLSFMNMPRLRLILAGSIANMTNLRRLSFANSRSLLYVSNEAFVNLTKLDMLSFFNCSLTVIPRTFANLSPTNHDLIDIRGNPLGCECMSQDLRTYSTSFWNSKLSFANQTTCESETTSRTIPLLNYETLKDKSCKTRIIPSSNISLNRTLGASVSLYCVVLSGFNYTVQWIDPYGSVLRPTATGRFQITGEQLFFAYSLLNDTGRYQCHVRSLESKKVVSRYVDLQIENPNIGLVVEDVSSQWVYLRWNKSASDMQYGEYLLEYCVTSSDITQRSYLPTVATTFRIADLKPRTNYTFCLLYKKLDDTLYRYCLDVETLQHVFGLGVTLNYSLIAVVAVSVSLFCALCVARCVHRHLHVWQEEKFRGRMQETLSAQGFLSSFESLTSSMGGTVAITYENPGALDASCEREEETALTSVPLANELESIPDETTHPIANGKTDISSSTTIQHQATVEPRRDENAIIA